MSYGEKMAGVSFNPSGDKDIDTIKRLFAKIIDFCHDRSAEPGERSAVYKAAIMESLKAQMLAVKAISWRDTE